MKPSMKSPIHRDLEMEPTEIEPGLSVYTCPKSKGVWMPMPSYLEWLQQGSATITPLPEGYKPETVNGTDRPALICPDSGCILTRYRVGHGLDFQIDRSHVTGGVWLDQGEWDALKSVGLHDHLTMIFTSPYQRKIRDEAHSNHQRAVLKDKVGEADIAKVDEFSRWLSEHPEKRFILSHLMDDIFG